MLGISGCYIKDGWVGLGNKSLSDGSRGVYESVMSGKRQFILVVGGNTVGAWVLLVIATMGWVGMEVVGREHAAHNQVGLATLLDMPEHFLCAMWEHCLRIMNRMPCRIFV